MISQAQLYFEKNSLLSSWQYGFRKGKSTICAIEMVVSGILEVFESQEYWSLSMCTSVKPSIQSNKLSL